MLTKNVGRKKLSGGEARKIAAAVARDGCAAELRRLKREIAAVVLSAERAMAAQGTERLVPFADGIGIPVMAEHVMPGEGTHLGERMARWTIITRTVMLPEWAVIDWRLSRVGIGLIDRWRNQSRQRQFSDIADDIRSVLKRRKNDADAALAKLPRGATVADAVRMWPGLRSVIERLVK